MTLSPKQSLVGLLLLCLIGVGLSRAPWLGRDIWSLDEGSTFTMAHQVLDGGVLYRDAADNRSPLVPYLKAAVFAIFGDWNASAVHLVLTLMIGLTVFGLGWIGLKLGGWTLAIPTTVSAWFLQIYWIDIGDAMSANTEWFLIAFSTAAFALFVTSIERPTVGRALCVGLLFGGSLMCKQPGLLDMLVALVLVGLLASKAEQSSRRKLIQFGAVIAVGTLLPLGAFSLHYVLAGAWDDYIFYAFTFNTEIYIAEVPFWERVAAVQKPFTMALNNAPLFGLLGVIAAGGLLFRALPQFQRKTPIELLPWLVLGWTASGLVSTMLSGREFAHYSEQIIPGLSLAVGWLFQHLGRLSGQTLSKWGRRIQVAIVIALLASVGIRHVQLGRETSASAGGPDPLGILAKEFSAPNEHLFVWGYYPEIYFLVQRAPSTRYIYTNYLTGMIPWTNLDPFVDVTNGISPGAQEKFESDFTARPPAVIVDTNEQRSYARFPIEGQLWLWEQITEHYAQVASEESNSGRMRIFRRLSEESRQSSPLPTFAEIESVLVISGQADLRPGSRPTIEVSGKQGFARLHLMIGDQPRGWLDHPADLPVRVRFFGDKENLDFTDVWVVAQRADGTWGRSDRFDFEAFVRKLESRPPAQPSLTFEGIEFPPAAVANQTSRITPYESSDELWNLVAPGYLRYPCPAGVHQITFTHGMKPDSVFLSDGYDVSLYWVLPDGNEDLIWRRRMAPHREGSHQFPQQETVDLPQRGRGELEFRFTNGPMSDAEYDQIYFGALTAVTDRPILTIGGSAILAEPETSGELIARPDGNWIFNAPAEIIWARSSNLMAFSFEFGIDSGAYEGRETQRTDGVGFELLLKNDDGSQTVLWQKILKPSSNPDDRNPQHVTIDLPSSGSGRLILSSHAGERDDLSWDWAYIGRFQGETTGPAISLPDGRSLPSIANDGWSDQQNDTTWGAQSPQQLVYNKPAELAALTLRFGISAKAARDEQGNRRSDGVQVRVVFQPENGDAIELFERFLDPYHQASDAGMHTVKFATNPGQVGKLLIRMEAGPQDDSSFDWAFWGEFEGVISR